MRAVLAVTATAFVTTVLVVSANVLLSSLKPIAHEYLTRRGFVHVKIELATLPCGSGPFWSEDFSWIGFEVHADQGDNPGRGRRYEIGRVCRVLHSDQWAFHVTQRYCFNYPTDRWIATDAEYCVR